MASGTKMVVPLPCDSDGVCMRCKVHPPDAQVVLCDSCSSPWHMACLDPPMETVPSGSWSCPDCTEPAPGSQPVAPTHAAAAADGAPQSLAAKIRALQEDSSIPEGEKSKRRQKLVEDHNRETAGAGGRKSKGSAGSKGSKGSKGSRGAEGACGSNGKGKAPGGFNGGGAANALEETPGFLEEKMNCVCCLMLVDRPVSTPCGHNYCLKCFERWVGQNKHAKGGAKCSACRVTIPPGMLKQPRINSTLVAAIRFAKAAAKAAAGGGSSVSGPRHYQPIANEQRPDTAFTTERAKKTGKANACSGKVFVTIPPDHFGPITAEYDPVRKTGVLVGESWADRLECRQWGAHFPHVAGIAGQSDHGAQSVALSGGYEDDEDNGEWFLYTGSGGRDLSGNKRTNKHHSFDQKFTSGNEALRLSCKKGYPVRVVRSHKEKRSSYAPEEGVRYDGIYRIERCWRKRGAGGFLVCRYLFVRCDNEAAPWTSEEVGDRPRDLPKVEELKSAVDITERKGRAAWDWNEEEEKWQWVLAPPDSKKLGGGSSAGTRKRTQRTAEKRLLKEFGCAICKKVLQCPVSTPCAHNFCKTCLEKKFAGSSTNRERPSGSGRTLRTQRVVKQCPAVQCSADIAEFLVAMQVNHEMVGLIDLLQKRAAEEKARAETGGEGDEGAAGKEQGEEEEEVQEEEEEENEEKGGSLEGEAGLNAKTGGGGGACEGTGRDGNGMELGGQEGPAGLSASGGTRKRKAEVGVAADDGAEGPGMKRHEARPDLPKPDADEDEQGVGEGRGEPCENGMSTPSDGAGPLGGHAQPCSGRSGKFISEANELAEKFPAFDVALIQDILNDQGGCAEEAEAMIKYMLKSQTEANLKQKTKGKKCKSSP